MNLNIETICNQYVSAFPQEREVLAPLMNQLRKGEADITSRSTFDTGHVTAGVLLVTMPSKAVLLLDHVTLKKQIQPGGHIEPEDQSVLDAAIRECEEETGIDHSKLTYVPLSEQDKEVPFGIQVHTVPANDGRGEPSHHHYDFWYLFTVQDGVAVASNDPGVANHQWVAFDVFAENPEFARQAEKIEKLLT